MLASQSCQILLASLRIPELSCTSSPVAAAASSLHRSLLLLLHGHHGVGRGPVAHGRNSSTDTATTRAGPEKLSMVPSATERKAAEGDGKQSQERVGERAREEAGTRAGEGEAARRQRSIGSGRHE